MPTFIDIASALTLPACCMRKNPSPKDNLKNDLKMLGISFALYITSYLLGYHSLCILSMATMNMITFQAGVTFHEAYSKTIHLNQFDELDSSMDDDDTDTRSLKQKEHGASVSNPMTEEQEEKLNEQFKQLVEETTLRNRKRNCLITARTPSSTTLVDDVSYPPMPPSDTEEDYKDMPPLVKPEEVSPVKSSSITLSWSEVPNFSQTHYLHNYMEDVD
jgi:hypothetical protein